MSEEPEVVGMDSLRSDVRFIADKRETLRTWNRVKIACIIGPIAVGAVTISLNKLHMINNVHAINIQVFNLIISLFFTFIGHVEIGNIEKDIALALRRIASSEGSNGILEHRQYLADNGIDLYDASFASDTEIAETISNKSSRNFRYIVASTVNIIQAILSVVR